MATGSLYGSVSESTGLYGIGAASGGTYFEWFIFYDSATAPATPTGGSWSFTTNTGTAPTGWLNAPPASPTNLIWVSIAVVDSRSTSTFSWSTPGLMTGSGLPILTASGVPSSGTGLNGQLYVNTATTPQSMYLKEAGSWVQITGSNLVDLVNNQTIGGTKTFSSPIVGSVTGTAANVTGTVAVANGGTGGTTASAARTSLGLGTISTQDASNVAITGGSISLTTALPIASGGTAGTTAATARSSLGAVGLSDTQTLTNKTISGASNTLTNIPNSSLNNSTFSMNGQVFTLGAVQTVGANLFLPSYTGNAGKVLALNSSASDVQWISAGGVGTVTSIDISGGTTGLTTFGGPITAAGTITLGGTLAVTNGGTGATTATAARTNLGATTVGSNMFSLTNPSAITFPRFNADNTVSALDAAAFRTAIGAGTSSTTGTVTSVSGAGTVNGLTLTGTVTASGSLTLGGTLDLSSPPAIGSTAANSGAFTTLSGSAVTSVTPVLSFNASNTIASFGTTTASSYNQLVIQNKSATAGASTNYVLSNDSGTDSTYYGEFGMNSSAYSASTPADYFSINNGVYFSAHDGDVTIGSGNGYKTYLAWGTTGQSAHVINAAGALGFSTSLGTTPALSGTTGFGTSGQALRSGGSAAAPSWGTLGTAGGGTGLTSFTANGVVYASSTSALTTGSALTFDGTTFTTTGAGGVVATGANGVQVNNSGGGAFQSTTGFMFLQSPTASGNGFIFRDTSAGSYAEYMRLTSTGLGIGTSSPLAKLDVRGGVFLKDSNSNGVIEATGGGSSQFYYNTSTNHIWQVAGAEKMRLDTSGNLGLGVTPSAWSLGKAVEVSNTGNALWGVSQNEIYITQNAYYSSGLKYASTAAAGYYGINTGAHRWFNAPSGTAGAAITFTQAMTLDASGNLRLGLTGSVITSTERMSIQSASGSIGLAINASGSGSYGIGIYGSQASGATSQTMILFQNSSSSTVGSITSNGTATAYNVTSDYRLKDIAGPVTNSGAFIDKLNPVQGSWKSDGSRFIGFLAHELQEASETVVGTGIKDGEEMQSIDYSNAELIANLVAELKSIRKRLADAGIA